MSGQKFSGIFKSLGELREVQTTPIVKAHSAPKQAGANVHWHFRSQEIAKRLRSEKTGGYWGAMKDRRYDDVVVTTLMKSGAAEGQVDEFLSSGKGEELGQTIHSRVVKSIGLAAHVQKMFTQWGVRGQEQLAKSVTTPLRKSFTEFGDVNKQ